MSPNYGRIRLLGARKIWEVWQPYVTLVHLTCMKHTHTHPFNGPFSGTIQVSWYQKGKTNLDFTEARDREWQWHQLGHMQVCTSLQTDNHASTPPLSFYRPDALSAAQPRALKAINMYESETELPITAEETVINYQHERRPHLIASKATVCTASVVSIF